MGKRMKIYEVTFRPPLGEAEVVLMVAASYKTAEAMAREYSEAPIIHILERQELVCVGPKPE